MALTALTATTCRLSVSDDGSGLPADPPTKQAGSGTTLIQILVRQIGGVMKVDTGEGTTFTIDFPRQAAAHRDDAEASPE